MRETTSRREYLLLLAYLAKHRLSLFQGLLSSFDSAEALFDAVRDGKDPMLAALPEGIRKRLKEGAKPGFLDGFLNDLDQKNIAYVTLEDRNYPALLKQIPDPPTVLFYRGFLPEEIRLPLGIVGARRCTRYGKDIARLFGNDFAKRGATVVSGLAAGIDGEAARGALDAAEAEYPTVAVLGTGIDVIYPKTNERMYWEIAERGAVVTEFFPGEPPLPEHFPQRNRIISGMSRGILVVEAGERSGTSITAGLALDQGRDVFAVPGRITDLMSIGTNRLIQQGAAKPVFCCQDVLCEYGISENDLPGTSGGYPDFSGLSGTELAIAEALKAGDLDVDTLAHQLSLSPSEVNCGLTALEFSGIIKPLPGRRFALVLQ